MFFRASSVADAVAILRRIGLGVARLARLGPGDGFPELPHAGTEFGRATFGAGQADKGGALFEWEVKGHRQSLGDLAHDSGLRQRGDTERVTVGAFEQKRRPAVEPVAAFPPYANAGQVAIGKSVEGKLAVIVALELQP